MSGPRQLAMFPLSTVLFPGALLPLHVFEARYRTMLAECLRVEPHEFGVVLIARGPEVGGGDERTDVGTVARIEALSRTDDGRYALVARGTKRFRVAQWLPDDPYPEAVVEELADEPEGQRAEAAAAVRRIEALLSELGSPVPDPPATPDTPLWELCSRVPVNTLDRQRLLEARDTTARVTLLVELAGALAEDLTMLLAGG